MNLFVDLIAHFGRFSGLPAIWLGRRSRSILWYYAWASFLPDLYSYVAYKLLHLSVNRLHFVIFTTAEFILVGTYYNRQITSKRLQKFIFGGIIALTVWYIADTAGKGLSKANWEAYAVLNIPLILLCVAALYKVIRNIEYANIERSPLFIFSAAFLLYASYSELLMLFTEHFRSAPVALRQQLWAVHNFLNGIKNLAIAYVFVLEKRRAVAETSVPIRINTNSTSL